MKKLISVALVVAMLLSMSVTASAAENSDTSFLPAVQVSEVDGIRTATYSDDKTTYIVTYDMLNNTVRVAQKDIESGVITYGSTESTLMNDSGVDVASSTIHQDTFCNFEYDIYVGNPNEWNLERPDDNDGSGQLYFMVYENSSNEEELDTWFDAVNALNDKEWEAVSDCGLAIVSAAAAGFVSGMAVASGGILTAGAISTIVAAAGATGAAATTIAQIGTCCNVCRLAYNDVYIATDNMHF